MTVSMISAQRTGIMLAATVVLAALVNRLIATVLAKVSEYLLLRALLKAGQIGWSLK